MGCDVKDGPLRARSTPSDLDETSFVLPAHVVAKQVALARVQIDVESTHPLLDPDTPPYQVLSSAPLRGEDPGVTGIKGCDIERDWKGWEVSFSLEIRFL